MAKLSVVDLRRYNDLGKRRFDRCSVGSLPKLGSAVSIPGPYINGLHGHHPQQQRLPIICQMTRSETREISFKVAGCTQQDLQGSWLRFGLQGLPRSPSETTHTVRVAFISLFSINPILTTIPKLARPPCLDTIRQPIAALESFLATYSPLTSLADTLPAAMEFVTALRGTLDDQKPSLFEVLSEQQLSGLLPPTLRYLLTVATHRHPRYLLRALNSFDELYALLMLLVERHYLRTRGGSFTEHFYGLKREKALRAEVPRASMAAPHLVRDTLKLTTKDVWMNLAVLVGVPYLKRKLDEGYEVNAPRALLGAAYTRMPDNPTLRDRFVHYYRWFLTNVYPSVNAAYYFAMLVFNLGYLFDRTKYHNPLLWLIGTRIRRMTGADYQAIDALSAAKPKVDGRPGQSFFSPRNLGSTVLSSLSIALPMSIFALKFLEWWYQSDFAKQLSRKATENIELPPPIVSGLLAKHLKKPNPATLDEKRVVGADDEATDPPETDIAAKDAPLAKPSRLPIHVVSFPQDSSCCPICLEDIVTPTACQTGVVYCYTCIHRWIEGMHPKQEAFMEGKDGQWESGQGRCAVTGRRVLGGTEGLRRIMI
ncbi:peroxisome biosynthesis protein (PAS10/Peroxin-12), putative [Cordyceps militaris CM01]|uniref:Peroxisome assembly protein 12 n=1 Tax=Cordyceps militaris (strain CM01) TaxID=983644 RepID=G3J8H5_CORMM|nr:peroxisome biosynthesis protein (PAS10/Peroxin-12), putative [Cordyceps militaris CM01]EGX94762.1 peroxisome biosynthesis protein (PAS10/Peroxin-12), putative [Cordyceps militaris CM01]